MKHITNWKQKHHRFNVYTYVGSYYQSRYVTKKTIWDYLENRMLTLGSLFDGIGGWQIATVKSGVKPIWGSEIEPFPLAVTKLRFPDTVQLGDITKIDGAKIPPLDIVCMGSPFQDLSIAGKREGLEGERSGLFRDYGVCK